MYETIVTAVGRVATTVSTHRFADDTLKATFRMACTERRREWTTGNWVDGDTLFLTVVCRKALAENVEASLRVGDPVVVRGRMHTREYETESRRTAIVEMDATTVGPDLSRCTTVVTRGAAGSARRPDDRGLPPGATGDGDGARRETERELVGAAAPGSERSEAAVGP